MEKISVSAAQAASVDAYLEYRRIVGDDDGGNLFSPEEFDQYKKEKLPQRLQNRLYVSWASPSGVDCKLVGPETPCFCTHRYKQHRTDFKKLPESRPIALPCRVAKCSCVGYNFVPLNGSQPIRCGCKHFADDHSPVRPYPCTKGGCTKCQGFKSSFTCGCGSATYEHKTIVETKNERQARGRPVGHENPYQAMGGITGFSSLADGYQRLDPSGIGAPSKEFLDQEVTAADHPFLRANLASMNAHRQIAGDTGGEYEADLAAQFAQMKRPDESDMDFFERRYQERQKQSRVSTHKVPKRVLHSSSKPP